MGSSSSPTKDDFGFVIGKPELDLENHDASDESIDFVDFKITDTLSSGQTGATASSSSYDGHKRYDSSRRARRPLEDDATRKKDPPFRHERVIAPICVMLLHAGLVSDVIIHRESLQTSSPWSWVIWLSTLLSCISYLSAALSDPGFLKRSGTRTPNPVAIGRQLYDRVRGDDKVTFKKNEEVDVEMAPLHEEHVHQDRLCKRCMIKQPLRTKHCRDCDWCIRTHDHHCPWLGNCVGENNRAAFFWFLTFQALELLLYLIEACRELFPGTRMTKFPSLLLICGGIVIGTLLLLVSCLWSFHLFLALANMTTWENVSWHRITYLRSIAQEKGSPFSRSLCDNLKIYCCSPGASSAYRYDESGYTVWEPGPPHIPKLMSCCSCLWTS